jgi:glucose/arabinose dehydrogenase
MPRPADKTIDKVIVPDVLMQPHNASLGMTFYDGTQFPAEYRGDIFAAEHGSWNRANTSGHEVVRVPLKNGKSDGTYEDFMTFLAPDGGTWGRATGVAVGKDGSLYVTDDGSNTIWKVSYVGNGKK